MGKITFEDKVNVKTSVLARENKAVAEDFNEIKEVVNDNDDILDAHVSDLDNPHETTKTQIGLGNVDNTSDADKPISNATQTALNAKQATLVSGTNIKTVNSTSLLGSGDLAITPNATHTGEVTGATSLTLDKTAISNKTLVALDPLDHILIGDASDSDNLKKVLASDFGQNGKVAIYDANGKPTFYSTLSLAFASATSGSTIQLMCQLCSTAKAARLSPTKAQRNEPPPSMTSTLPVPSFSRAVRTRVLSSCTLSV